MSGSHSKLMLPEGPLRLLGSIILLAAALGACSETGDTSASDVQERRGTGTAAEVQQALGLDNRLASIEELARVLQTLPQTKQVAAEVASAFEPSMTDRGDIELVLVAEWWTPFDPEGAFTWSRKAWRAEHPRIAYAVMRSMARLSAQDAIDAYQEIPVTPESFSFYLQPIIVGWFESGQPGLIEFIRAQPSLELQQLALGTLARLQVLALGPEKSIEWAEATVVGQDETFERHLFQRVASSIAELEPQTAADWIEDLIKNRGASETLLRRVGGRWARRDPHAAFAWLGRFDSSPHQQQAIAQTYNLWFALDQKAATEWILAQGDAMGTTFASATHSLLKNRALFAKKDPDLAVDWIDNLDLSLGIEDEEKRWAAITALCRVWITRDEAAASAWMDGHAVPESYLNKIRSALTGPGEMKPRTKS